jgi:chloride channel protein, CIC family
MKQLHCPDFKLVASALNPFSSRKARLRILAHTRRIVLLMLPLGALMGIVVAVSLSGLERLEHRIFHMAEGGHWTLLLPGVGLVLVTLWLTHLQLGTVSLSADIRRAHRSPYEAFPFRESLAKVAACVLTIGFGGSAGVEGPGKWLGAAVGVQVHRSIKTLAYRYPFLRRWLVQPMTIVVGGAAGAMAAIFRAPLSGALLAAEKDGVLGSERLVSAVVAAAAGYLSFSLWSGRGPLLPYVAPMGLSWREIAWSVPLGLLCGIGVGLFRGMRASFRLLFQRWTLPVRGAVAGTILILLAMPAFFLWNRLPVTQGGGLEMVSNVINNTPSLQVGLAFFLLKTLATAVTFEGGGVGGTWLPSVAMGAALGASFEALIHTGHFGLMALLGATAFTGAVHGTLLVPVVFLAETTAQASLVVPGLVATTVAFLAARETHEV